MTKNNLTDPQVNLLLRLHAGPKPLVADYRPLQPLILQDLARPRAVRAPGSNYVYELTTKGAMLAMQIIQERADAENSKSAGH